MSLAPFLYIFQNLRILLKAAFYAFFIFILLSVPTAIIPNPVIHFIRTIPVNFFDYFFVVTTSLLSATYLVIPKNRKCDMDNQAFAGGFFGFLGFACPTCNFFLVGLLGFSTVLNFFDPLRPFIGFFSIIILSYAINKKWKGGT